MGFGLLYSTSSFFRQWCGQSLGTCMLRITRDTLVISCCSPGMSTTRGGMRTCFCCVGACVLVSFNAWIRVSLHNAISARSPSVQTKTLSGTLVYGPRMSDLIPTFTLHGLVETQVEIVAHHRARPATLRWRGLDCCSPSPLLPPPRYVKAVCVGHQQGSPP
ncbi:hypothetical protein XENOCAPTIV_004470 [Xenoophorus captivus]|uniref:Uncharacterized protein n=1 Tax=Xenoophorus captivus TaxID=1517983 RepID=A0ABV0RNS2_9TELE